MFEKGKSAGFSMWDIVYKVPHCGGANQYSQTRGWDYRVERLTGSAYIYHCFSDTFGYTFEALSSLINKDGTPVNKQQLIDLLVSQGIIK